MSRPAIQSIKLSPDVTLSECHPDSERRTVHWVLYDKRAGMNLSIGALTKEAVLLEALNYWAKRFIALEKVHTTLSVHVDTFVDAVRPVGEVEWL